LNKIPIRNIYYLLSYAWDYSGLGSDKLIGIDTFKDVDDLYAALLDISLSNLYRRGFRSEYCEELDEIKGIRGKLHLSQTIKSASLAKGSTWCEFDEFTIDNKFNQIIRGAIKTLLRSKKLHRKNILKLRQNLSRFSDVTEMELASINFYDIRFNSHNIHYRFIIELCKLIQRSISISEHTQEIHLRNFIDSETEMFRVFESFVLNFYKRELLGVNVRRDGRLRWNIQTQSDLFAERVPDLNTDISIFHPDKTLIIDTKFYQDALVSNRGQPKYRREHLSQLMEYLRISQRDYNKLAVGALLYPAVNQSIFDIGTIEGFSICVATVDLSKSWEEIHSSLIELAKGQFSLTQHKEAS
jgi:5-methylcytosine-specific restriction enzyme subunit McrC